MQLKDVIVISTILLFSSFEVLSQPNGSNTELTNNLQDFVSTYNNDSIVRIYKTPINTDWNELLRFSVLNRNINGRIDSSIILSPFEPFPIDEILSIKDLEFMKKCFEKCKNKRWNNNQIGNNFVEVIKRRVNFEKLKSIKDFHEVSLPVFSRNGEIAILQINHFCGMECGEGILLILQNKNGKWERLCHVTLWIS